MKKYRQWIAICAALLIISGAIVPFTPIDNKHTQILHTMGRYRRTEDSRCITIVDQVSYKEYAYTKVNMGNDTYFKHPTEKDVRLLRERIGFLLSYVGERADSNNRSAKRLLEHCDFAPDCISENDFFYFRESIPGFAKGDSDTYELYLFDVESQTMYCFGRKTYLDSYAVLAPAGVFALGLDLLMSRTATGK